MRWYNVYQRQSGIRYVSPLERHADHDKAIPAGRHDLCIQAQQRKPARWSRSTRAWSHIGAVTLNPERDAVVNTAAAALHTQQKAA